MQKRYEKQICFIMVIVMFFVGMCLEMAETDSSFLYANLVNAEADAIEAENYVMDQETVFALDMMHNRILTICRGLGNTILFFSIVGISLQYLFYYQSSEIKEDGQLFLCRSVAVRYIHQKDGEK